LTQSSSIGPSTRLNFTSSRRNWNRRVMSSRDRKLSSATCSISSTLSSMASMMGM